MKKHEIINKLIKENGYSSYLEIGLYDLSNFKKVECQIKLGIDPNLPYDDDVSNNEASYKQTSDEFFSLDHGKWDIIYIDGLHHSDQLERDILNSWKCLNPKGMILIHDIKPRSEEMTIIPRQTKQWTGDVFKCWAGLQKTNLKLEYIEEEFGLGVIHKSRHKLEAGFASDITFQEYFDNKGWLIN